VLCLTHNKKQKLGQKGVVWEMGQFGTELFFDVTVVEKIKKNNRQQPLCKSQLNSKTLDFTVEYLKIKLNICFRKKKSNFHI
jgi:hypothetical protein